MAKCFGVVVFWAFNHRDICPIPTLSKDNIRTTESKYCGSGLKIDLVVVVIVFVVLVIKLLSALVKV